MAIAVRQVVAAPLTSQGSNPTISFSANVLAGSTLALVGVGRNSSSGETVVLSSATDSRGNTWQTPANVQLAGSYTPNAFGALAYNVAAGATTVTASVNQSANAAISWALLEITGAPTSAALDKTAVGEGTSDSAGSVSTASTGTLSQADNLAIIVAGGYFGVPQNPSGWTSVLSQQNGAAVGAQISYKTVAATTAITGTVAHETGANTSLTSALLLVIKQATTSNLRYKFLLNSSTLTSADTAITGYVWRNGSPDTVLAEKYTGLAGSSTAGTLYITGVPSGAAVTDTVTGSFFNATDESSPFITGTVETY